MILNVMRNCKFFFGDKICNLIWNGNEFGHYGTGKPNSNTMRPSPIFTSPKRRLMEVSWA